MNRRRDLPREAATLEARARSIAEMISKELGGRIDAPGGTGFALLLFDFGDDGNLTWISNADRAGMLQVLRTMVARCDLAKVLYGEAEIEEVLG